MADAGSPAFDWSHEVPALGPGALHLWYCDLDVLTDANLLGAYRALLDADETRRLHRLLPEREKHRFLVSHAFLRHVLSRYGRASPDSWRFVKGQHGKPALEREQARSMPGFNLSHSGSMAVLAVCRNARNLGVDIEFHRPMREFLALARRNFAATETQRLLHLEGSLLAAEFYDFWTLKESFIKACGVGLSQALGDFWFGFDRDTARLSFDALPALEPEPWAWSFWSYRLPGPYSAALAVQPEQDAGYDEPLWFAAVPGRIWSPLALDCSMRSSRITAI